jgi:hypothetical protein
MTVRRHALPWLLFAALLGGTGRLAAQRVTLAISAVVADSTSPAPVMTVTAFDIRPELGPYSVSLELSMEPQFRTPFFVKAADQGAGTTFHVDELLPERTVVYFRARLIDGRSNIVAEATDRHPVRSWLRLEAPAAGNPFNLGTRTPRFVWSSPAITVPPGLWVYDLTVINKQTQQADLFQPGLNDTSFAFAQPLESNTSYRWQVHARAQSGRPSDTVTVTREGSFVISSADQPSFTLLYQNFPNPFGRGERSDSTCFWFDLARDAKVKLTIYTVQLQEVRNIIPGRSMSGTLARGAYGRKNVDTGGCDERFTWDGRDDSGRLVPTGVYLVVFEGDGPRQYKKIVFKRP